MCWIVRLASQAMVVVVLSVCVCECWTCGLDVVGPVSSALSLSFVHPPQPVLFCLWLTLTPPLWYSFTLSFAPCKVCVCVCTHRVLICYGSSVGDTTPKAIFFSPPKIHTFWQIVMMKQLCNKPLCSCQTSLDHVLWFGLCDVALGLFDRLCALVQLE